MPPVEDFETVHSDSEEKSDLTEMRGPDIEILRLLGSDGGVMAFQGMRRRMNIHQEKLSRALHRLEDDGYVQHTPKGYALTPQGSSVAHQWLSPPSTVPSIILQSYLPGDVDPMELTRRLEGRWFTSLRWLGSKEENGGVALRWITDRKGVEVTLRITWGHIRVETDARDSVGMNEAFYASQRILAHLTGPWEQERGRNMLADRSAGKMDSIFSQWT